MLTISCITCNFCAFNIINRKKAGGDVMGGYSHLFPSGHLPRFIFSWFCVPVYNVVFMARAASPRRSPLPVVSRCSTQKRHVITCSPLPVVSRCSTQKHHVIT